MYFECTNLFLDTCFYLHYCPYSVSPKENHGRGLIWYLVNGVVFLLQWLCLALGKGEAQITACSKWVCAGNAHCWSFVHSTSPINCQISW